MRHKKIGANSHAQSFFCTKTCNSSSHLLSRFVFEVKQPVITWLILCILYTNLTNKICYLTARAFISTGLSDTDNNQHMPLDWSGISSCLALAVRRYGFQLALCTAWGEFSENMTLSKWPFGRTHRDRSNWHVLLLSTERKCAMLCRHFTKKEFWNCWFKMKYNIISCSLSIHIMSHR